MIVETKLNRDEFYSVAILLYVLYRLDIIDFEGFSLRNNGGSKLWFLKRMQQSGIIR